MTEENSTEGNPPGIGQGPANTEQLKGHRSNHPMTKFGKDPDTRPLVKLYPCLPLSGLKVQGLGFAVIDTGTAQGTVITDNGTAIDDLNCGEGTVGLADPATYTFFGINS